jgi:hypothetical protein
MCWWLCWWMCWCADLLSWCVDVWCVEVLMCSCVDVLTCWRVTLMCWRMTVLMCWVLMYRYWCVDMISWKKLYFHTKNKKNQEEVGLNCSVFALWKKRFLSTKTEYDWSKASPWFPNDQEHISRLDSENSFRTSSKWRSTEKREIFQKTVQFWGSYASDRKTDFKSEFFIQFLPQAFFSAETNQLSQD